MYVSALHSPLKESTSAALQSYLNCSLSLFPFSCCVFVLWMGLLAFRQIVWYPSVSKFHQKFDTRFWKSVLIGVDASHGFHRSMKPYCLFFFVLNIIICIRSSLSCSLLECCFFWAKLFLYSALFQP